MITPTELKAQFQHIIDNCKYIEEIKEVIKEMEPYHLPPEMAERKRKIIEARRDKYNPHLKAK